MKVLTMRDLFIFSPTPSEPHKDTGTLPLHSASSSGEEMTPLRSLLPPAATEEPCRQEEQYRTIITTII